MARKGIFVKYLRDTFNLSEYEIAVIIDKRTYQEKEDAINRQEEKKRLKAEAHAKRLKKKEERDKLLGYKK